MGAAIVREVRHCVCVTEWPSQLLLPSSLRLARASVVQLFCRFALVSLLCLVRARPSSFRRQVDSLGSPVARLELELELRV